MANGMESVAVAHPLTFKFWHHKMFFTWNAFCLNALAPNNKSSDLF